MNNDMTKKFRKLLDDNGIEWMVGSTGSHEFDTTSFRIEDQWWAADTYEECIELMTVVAKPEKVIALTLKSGMCELTETDSYSNANEVIHVLECSACGETCEHVNGSYPRCPHCGRKVVSV